MRRERHAMDTSGERPVFRAYVEKHLAVASLKLRFDLSFGWVP